MAKNLDKCSRCRREGTKLFLKGDKCFTAKCPAVRRNYPPGAHGPKGRPRSTEFGQQLREKQKAKKIYGILERQFSNYYKKAMKKTGDTGEFISQMLEMRLDNVIFRAGFAKSRAMARQMVSHGFILVNNKKVDIPSYQVRAKEEITIKPKKAGSKIFANLNLEGKQFPSWLFVEPKEMKIKIVSKPKLSEIEQTFNPRLIVEFYSR